MKPRGPLLQGCRNLAARLGFGAFVLCWLVGALHGAIRQKPRPARRLHQ